MILNPKVYKNISYDELVTYSLFNLSKEKKMVTFESLVAECFKLFPARFHLVGYPHWPDSSVIEKSWRRCKTDLGYIIGSKAAGFRLTPKGLRLVEKLSEILNTNYVDKLTIGKLKGDSRTKSGRLVKQVENSLIYRNYIKDKASFIPDNEQFCELIYCTPETKENTKKRNLAELRQHLETYNRKDLIDFIDMCFNKLQGDGN